MIHREINFEGPPLRSYQRIPGSAVFPDAEVRLPALLADPGHVAGLQALLYIVDLLFDVVLDVLPDAIDDLLPWPEQTLPDYTGFAPRGALPCVAAKRCCPRFLPAFICVLL